MVNINLASLDGISKALTINRGACARDVIRKIKLIINGITKTSIGTLDARQQATAIRELAVAQKILTDIERDGLSKPAVANFLVMLSQSDKPNIVQCNNPVNINEDKMGINQVVDATLVSK